jgi:hypothetical protein
LINRFVDQASEYLAHNKGLPVIVGVGLVVANYFIQQRSQVGLFVNSRLPDTNQPAKILPGGGLPRLLNILESLAK